MDSDDASACFRELIFGSRLPIVFPNSIDWNFLKWSIEDWCKAFSDKVLSFRSGIKTCTEDPVWESECETEYHTFEEFVKLSNEVSTEENKWWYFDYKHIPEHFADEKDLFMSMSWSALGFPEKNSDDSTIWIGSSGAHTACHFDSYGCNLVAQVLGKKRWILFPPSEITNLKPTRIPYEESSIYSLLNFSCSRVIEKNLKSKNCFLVDLNPGEVLLIPPKWWHYVENLSLGISVNTWIPVESDDVSRLDEALVRYLISCLTNSASDDIKRLLLNPNEHDIEFEIDPTIIEFCGKKIKDASESISTPVSLMTDFNDTVCHMHHYKIVRAISNVELLGILPKCSISHKSGNSKFKKSSLPDNISTLVSVINAFCHPDIICQVRNKVLRQ